MADHDDERHPPGSGRANHARRLAAVLLGGCPRQEPDALSGGLLGGTWLTSLFGDIGHGIFDGANLVANFENLNPANTFGKSPTTSIRTWTPKRERFLEFEKWWGSPVLLNAEEMQFITDELFVGIKLYRRRDIHI